MGLAAIARKLEADKPPYMRPQKMGPLPEGSPHREQQTQPIEAPTRAQVLVQQLSRALARSDLEKVKRSFARIAKSPLDLEEQIDLLQRLFLRADRGQLLLDLLLARPVQTLRRLRLIARAIELGRTLGRESDVENAVSGILNDADFPVIQWGASDQLNRYKTYGTGLFRALKYRGVTQLLENLFESAEALSGRIDLPQPLLDRLFASSRYKTMPRAQWERHIRTAFAVDHITKDLLPVRIERAKRWLAGTVDFDGALVERTKAALESMDPGKGLLMVTFHGGFSRIALVLYQHLFKDGAIVMGGKFARKDAPVDDRYIVVWKNERTALFQALRALQDRKTLWIGGDAQFGNLTVSIDMLGTPLPVPDGPPFLAYESSCNTAWLSFVREGNGIVPVIVPGPVRTGKEKYKEFRDRWLKFYEERIDEFMTGDPRNIALRPFLMEILSRAS